MARKTKILSFDDAKNASQQRRVRVHPKTDDRYEDIVPDPYGLSGNPSYASFLERYSNPASASADNWLDGPADSEDDADFDEEMDEARIAPHRSKREQRAAKRERRRRERAKERAGRQFDRQFDSDRSFQAQEEGAPRAALYEGKMGASHRRSARMQRASSALPQTAKLNPAGWFSNIRISPRALKVGTAILCLILVAVFLYTPAQQYYQATREHDRLAAEYEVVSQRNSALDAQIDSLTSNAGMEDAVRQKYGYVVDGDETAIVQGLSDRATDTSRDSEDIEANVLSSSVKAPEEWYTPFLDAFFGVS